jgi:hypothetical protein
MIFAASWTYPKRRSDKTRFAAALIRRTTTNKKKRVVILLIMTAEVRQQ